MDLNDVDSGGKHSEKRSMSDVAVYVLSGALLIAMLLASIYGWRYGNVDTSVACGNISIKKSELPFIDLSVDKDLNATVYHGYIGREMKGKLVLAGAETDTILFQLKDMHFTDGGDPSQAILFIRMPRTGLQGDYAGVWMTYFSYPSEDVKISEWIIADEGGNAISGLKTGYNVITAQRNQLGSYSNAWTWQKAGSSMILTTL